MRSRIVIVALLLPAAGCGGGGGSGMLVEDVAQGAGADTGSERLVATVAWSPPTPPPATAWTLEDADGTTVAAGDVAWSGRRAHIAATLAGADGERYALHLRRRDGRPCAAATVVATRTPPPVLKDERDPAIADAHVVVDAAGRAALHVALLNRHRDGETLLDVGWEVRDEAGAIVATGVLPELAAATSAEEAAGAIPLTQLVVPLGTPAPGQVAWLFALDPARRFVPEYCRFNNLRRAVLADGAGRDVRAHVHRYRFTAAFHASVRPPPAGCAWRILREDDGAVLAEGTATEPLAVGVPLAQDGDGEIGYRIELTAGGRLISSATAVADWTPTGAG